ncbi:phosphorylase family protein [Anaeromyxobacter paludicola]|uniref:Nucleoside phosphorylase domain-containing protein n=1 Tax=Anaeromyxobacter paludicola TaxID=2918171 RepID=A0ABM7XAU3_9BACT|nr:hypothetical protein [Anaeromyxobacter paludicola]BDG08961.1 hypothetical protein AMPC_20740 [Anaeromyxobacter paludicola]
MILVCAATGAEAAACREGLLGAAGFEVLATGVGPARAAAALRRRLREGARPVRVVSSGFCGALSADLAPLAWATATSLHRLEAGRARPVALRPGTLGALDGAVPCAFLTAEAVVGGGDFGLPAPAAVDMESAALAEAAEAAGLPFAVLRLVTDAPGRPLPRLAGLLGGALSARGLGERAAFAARAAVEAARAPARAAAFLRETSAWRERLREGWRERAATCCSPSPLGRGG